MIYPSCELSVGSPKPENVIWSTGFVFLSKKSFNSDKIGVVAINWKLDLSSDVEDIEEDEEPYVIELQASCAEVGSVFNSVRFIL